MSQENQITLRGYLTAEPRLYQKTPQAVPLTELRVGCTPRRLNHETGEWRELPTSYFRIKCWRRLAINAVSSLHKGDRVLIRGRFYMNSWVDNQQRPRSTLEIEADTLGHDLAYGWSHYLRGSRPSGDGAAVNSGEMARQDTGAAAADEPDAEYPPDLEFSEPDEPDESAETIPPPGGQEESENDAGHPGVTGAPQADEWRGGSEPEDTVGAPGVTGDTSSLEREPVPL